MGGSGRCTVLEPETATSAAIPPRAWSTAWLMARSHLAWGDGGRGHIQICQGNLVYDGLIRP